MLATGLPWGGIKSTPPLFFVGIVVLPLPPTSVYSAQCFGCGFHRQQSCTHSVGLCPLILSLSLISVSDHSISLPGSLSTSPPFSLIFVTPLSNSPVAVLVCVQVSHPTDRWGRCRCKWISSLTLAPESTKSAWRVSFFLHSGLLFSISIFIPANIPRHNQDGSSSYSHLCNSTASAIYVCSSLHRHT